ncbi:MAG: ABC transporter ATP-binding protein [Acidobacteria bacterium]|nr:MAG: ABC transporter ATP-binding protein [Acidobacteriota bacterium]
MKENGLESAIKIGDLRKAFGEQRVLNGINLQVRQGETVAILGRSGGGKSVLLKLIIGLQSPDAGSIRVAGQEITKLEENEPFPLSRHAKVSTDERSKRVHELLADVGMDRDLQKMPAEISGGMQKRVGLARALALNPEILLFDEPTAGLDPITAAEIGELIVDLKRKRRMSAIVVTHDVHGARTYSDRMVLLHEGNIVAEGTFDELQSSQDEFVAQFFGYGSRS